MLPKSDPIKWRTMLYEEPISTLFEKRRCVEALLYQDKEEGVRRHRSLVCASSLLSWSFLSYPTFRFFVWLKSPEETPSCPEVKEKVNRRPQKSGGRPFDFTHRARVSKSFTHRLPVFCWGERRKCKCREKIRSDGAQMLPLCLLKIITFTFFLVREWFDCLVLIF